MPYLSSAVSTWSRHHSSSLTWTAALHPHGPPGFNFPHFHAALCFHAIIYSFIQPSSTEAPLCTSLWLQLWRLVTCWTKSKGLSLAFKASHHPTSSWFPQHHLRLLHPGIQSPCPQFRKRVVVTACSLRQGSRPLLVKLSVVT